MSQTPARRTDRDIDHQPIRNAVNQWWETRQERRGMTATWWPAQGLPAFLQAFDPTGELGDLGGVFTPLANGNLVVHWAGQTHTIEPGWSWTYRPRRDRKITLPLEVIDPTE